MLEGMEQLLAEGRVLVGKVRPQGLEGTVLQVAVGKAQVQEGRAVVDTVLLQPDTAEVGKEQHPLAAGRPQGRTPGVRRTQGLLPQQAVRGLVEGWHLAGADPW